MHLLKSPNSNARLTLLDCELGRHTGHFPISRVILDGVKLWTCEECLIRVAAPIFGEP